MIRNICSNSLLALLKAVSVVFLINQAFNSVAPVIAMPISIAIK